MNASKRYWHFSGQFYIINEKISFILEKNFQNFFDVQNFFHVSSKEHLFFYHFLNNILKKLLFNITKN